MARTPAQTATLEKKALAEENKSEGMRTLFEAGYTVADVRATFDAPYGYVYGVAKRWAESTGNPMPVEEVEAAPAKTAKTKTAAKPAAKAAPKAAPKGATKVTAKPAAKTAARTKATAKA